MVKSTIVDPDPTSTMSPHPVDEGSEQYTYSVVASVPPTSGRTITSIALSPDSRLIAVGDMVGNVEVLGSLNNYFIVY